MTALNRLAAKLAAINLVKDLRFPVNSSIDIEIKKLEQYIRNGLQTEIATDLHYKAVKKFWETHAFDTFKEARLVAFGLCIPIQPSGLSIMDDQHCFRSVFDDKTGIERWLKDPRRYRRCFQGLIRCYFTYDISNKNTTEVGKQNWEYLRDYLYNRINYIIGSHKITPEWVKLAIEHKQLFSTNPCAPYAADMLNGNTTVLDLLCEQLGIIKASWFLRKLVLAQIRHAIESSSDTFCQLLPQLLKLLADNELLQSNGLTLILNRYVQIPGYTLNTELRDTSVKWWGNPWLPSSKIPWSRVHPEAKTMIENWLKAEFIEAFFTKLAKDGVGDRRRVNFWLRYVKSMDNIQFALGPIAYSSTDHDFKKLRQKMAGLYQPLVGGTADNNAFIMTMNNLVAVEFGAKSNALYVYAAHQDCPFNQNKPMRIKQNARNSLKNSNRLKTMIHKDRTEGFARWEQRFEAVLRKDFGILPSECSQLPDPDDYPYTPSEPAPPKPEDINRPLPFSPSLFNQLVRKYNLEVNDDSSRNGHLWVKSDQGKSEIIDLLKAWGFKFKVGKGWWR